MEHHIVKCLEFPVVTQGETREEALGNLEEVIKGYLKTGTDIFLGKKVRYILGNLYGSK
jgi:hypothetical protein